MKLYLIMMIEYTVDEQLMELIIYFLMIILQKLYKNKYAYLALGNIHLYNLENKSCINSDVACFLYKGV